MENNLKEENLNSKENKYEKIYSTLKEFFSKYSTLSSIGKMASISSAIKKEFKEFTFVGFYIVKNEENKDSILEIGPYVSSILATPLIGYGKGVCGTSWQLAETRIVSNVTLCDNYIACSPDVLSEIVIPVFENKTVIAVLDIDANVLNRFDEIDQQKLQLIIKDFYN